MTLPKKRGPGRPRDAALALMRRGGGESRAGKKTPSLARRDERDPGPWRGLYLRLMDEGRVRRMPPERIMDVVAVLVYGSLFSKHVLGRDRPLEEQADD